MRGIKELDLELGEKSLLVYGENGTGKSSIVDAIEFFFTGTISHLEGAQGLSVKNHGTHAKCSPKDVEVSLVFNPGANALHRTFNAEPTVPPHLQDFFDIAQKGRIILRRSQILEFIYSKPADRFRAVGRILGIERLDEIESAFMKARDYFAGQLGSREEAKAAALSALSLILGRNITLQTDTLSALNGKLSEQGLERLESFDEALEYESKLIQNVQQSSDSEKIAYLKDILESIAGLESESIDKRMKQLRVEVDELLKGKAEKQLSFMKMLEEGQQLLAAPDLDTCPLCNQTIHRKTVIESVDRRLRLLASLSQKASQVRQDSTRVLQNLQEFTFKIKAICAKLESHQSEFLKDLEDLKEAVTETTSFIETIDAVRNLQTKLDYRSFSRINAKVKEVICVLESKCNQNLRKIRPAQQDEARLALVRMIEQTKSQYYELSELDTTIGQLKRQQDLAQRMFTSYSDIKKLKIQEIHNTIQEEVEHFYEQLHHNEEHGNIKLIVDLTKRASTDIKVDSYDKSVDPRAYQSEGHLDSLGICIFLAFVKRFNTNCSLVILDDIVTTIDSRHRIGICELIFQNFADKQLVITTHDNIWNEQLIAQQVRFKIQGQFQNISIDDWDIDDGLKIRDYKPRKERIEERLHSGDKNGAANDIRQYLEWLLKELCENLQAEIAFKQSGRYTVGDLLSPSRKRIERLVKDCQWKNDTILKYDAIQAMTILGNLLSHDNLDALGISMTEIREFYDAIQELEKKFQCNSCRGPLHYDRTASNLGCNDHKCTDHTLILTK